MADREHTIECATCGTTFRAAHRRKYCKPECRQSHWAQNSVTGKTRAQILEESRAKNTQTCQGCGKVFTRRKRRNDSCRFCSRECAFGNFKRWYNGRADYYWGPYTEVGFEYCVAICRKCDVCGKGFVGKAEKHRICGEGCRRQHARDYALRWSRDNHTPEHRACRECCTVFAPDYGNKRRVFCSDKCSKRHSSRANKRSIKKLVLKYGGLYQWVNPIKVFVRDGWCCQICGKRTPRARRGTCYSNAPELDHRVPLSLGGDHTYDNTQCACRQCNHSKSNTSSVGQLPMWSAV